MPQPISSAVTNAFGFSCIRRSANTYGSRPASIIAPTWCVECKYAESAARALTADGAEEDETEARGYQQEKGWTILLIDARTGRMIDPEDETAGRYVYAL